MKQSFPKSVDEYIAGQAEAVRPKLEQVRAAIRRAVPEAVEGIGYRMPGYKLHGKPMLYFAVRNRSVGSCVPAARAQAPAPNGCLKLNPKRPLLR